MSKKNVKLEVLKDENKARALDDFLTSMNKEKPNEVLKLNQSQKTHIAVSSTGIVSLDVAIGAGGFPFGKVIELYGPEGSGKTTVALNVAALAQKNGSNVGFIDAEHGLNRELCVNLGIDPDKFVVNQPNSGEDAIDMVEKMIRSGAFDVIIVDSIAAMVPKAEILAEVEQQHMGLHARLMSKFMRRVVGIANEAGVMLILINQIRKNLAAYGTPDETTGGKAIKFYSSLRIEVRTSSSKKISRGSDVVGHTVVATVKKNKLGAPFKTAEFDIIYGEGIDSNGALLDVAEQVGVISRSGAYYTLTSTGERISETDEDGKVRSVIGREAVKQYLKDNPDFLSKLNALVLESLDSNPSFMLDYSDEE